MIVTNELRRLAQAATSGGWYVERGKYVYGCKDVTDGEEEWRPVIACTDDDETNVNFEGNAAFIAAANPAAVSELLDRLEAAEKERDDVAQQLVQSEQGKRKISEECDALSAELSKQQTLTVAAQHIAEVAQRRANQLRAKVAEMEKQPPICRIKDIRRAHYMTKVVGLDPEAWLYALPGAKGEEK